MSSTAGHSEEWSANQLLSYNTSLQRLNALEPADVQASAKSRHEALAAAKDLVRTLEEPDHVAMTYAFQSGSQRMALRFGVDLGIYKKLCATSPLTSRELAESCGCEELLLIRMMRMITHLGFVEEVGEFKYAANSLTKSMTRPGVEASMIISYDYSGIVQARAHEYFKERGYSSPTEVAKSPFQWHFKTEKTYFQYLYSDPEVANTFNTLVAGVRLNRKHWSDWFPVKSEIIDAQDGTSAPAVVDVGGSKGHDLVKLVTVYPEIKGRVVLQDLPSVLEGLKLDGVECMAHDFFTPQPLHGARAYYMHFVLHDWPDQDCIRIITNIKSAMKRGYSKLYLNEHVVPTSKVPPWLVAMDLNMMTILSGAERTEKQWRDLVAQTGLVVNKVWRHQSGQDTEAILELILPQDKE